MDIAKLGVSIDPTRTISGAEAVKSQLRDIGNTAARELGRLDRANEKSGRTAEKTASTTKKSFDSMVNSNRNFVRSFQSGNRVISTFMRNVTRASLATVSLAEAILMLGGAAGGTVAVLGALSSAVAGSAVAMAAQAAMAARGGVKLLGYGKAATSTALAIAGIGTAALSSVAGVEALTRAMERHKRAGAIGSASRMIGDNGMRQARGRVVGETLAIGGGGPPKLPTGPPKLPGGGPPPLPTQQVTSGLASMTSGLGRFLAMVGSAAAAIVALVAVLATLAIAVGGVMLAFKLVAQGMELAGPVQRAQMSFEALTGSTKESIRILEELRKKSRETGADLEASMTTVKKFTALGFSPDEAIKLNSSILDVAGAVGLTSTEAKELGNALAQVQAKGVVSMEELRQQIAEKGIPIIQELATKLGVSSGALVKMVSDGKVKSKELIDIFMNLEGSFSRFRGGAEKMTKTLPGALDRLKAVWADLLIDIGKPINEALAPLVNSISDLLVKLKPAAQAIGEGIGNALKVLYMAMSDGTLGQTLALALSAGIEQAAAWFVVGFVQQIHIIQTALVQGLTMAITLPIDIFVGLFTAGINLLASLLTGTLGESTATVTTGFQTGMGTAINYIATSLYNALGQAVENVVNAFMRGMMGVVNASAGAFNKMVDGARGLPGGEKLFGKKGTGAVATNNAIVLDVFTPQALPDISKIGDQIVGTGAREELAKKAAAQLEEFKKRFNNDVEDPFKPKKEIADEPKEKKEKKGRQKKEKDNRSEFQKLYDDWTNMAKQLDQIAVGIAQSMSANITDGLMSIVDGTKSVKQAFSDMATSIINDIVRQVIQMWIQIAVARLLNAVMTSAGGVAHVGGVMGGMGMASTGSTATMSGGVPTHHTGGVGSSSEAMVKVDRGETILTRSRASEIEDRLDRAKRERGGGRGDKGGGGITIVNAVDPQMVSDAIAAKPQIILNAMSRQQPQVRRIATSRERV